MPACDPQEPGTPAPATFSWDDGRDFYSCRILKVLVNPKLLRGSGRLRKEPPLFKTREMKNPVEDEIERMQTAMDRNYKTVFVLLALCLLLCIAFTIQLVA